MEHCSIQRTRQIAEKAAARGRGLFAQKSAADAACYTAKEKGRKRIHVHHPNDEELAQLRGEMQRESRIDAALEEERMHLYCQPIVPLGRADARIGRGSAPPPALRFEVQLRMEEENGELTEPGAFLPAAERYNLVARLDMWVIECVFRWFAAYRDSCARLEHYVINLSGSSLGHPRVVDLVREPMDDAPIRPNQL